MPIVTGYLAASGRLDLGAGLLCAVLVFWQMPHFYAIAIYRYYDYFGAGVPVLPIKKGFGFTKAMIALYIPGFIAAVCLLYVFGFTGFSYLIVMLLVSLVWFFKILQGFGAKDDAAWARQVFRYSLAVLLVFSLMISLEHLLV